MRGPVHPERIAIEWSTEARANLRAFERKIAMHILYSRRRRAWRPRADYRLRCGAYRVFFDYKGLRSIRITGVKDRQDAYR
jgi:mRNA-degrading endonuclease RelE of RelBE toxin-antitoxin system